MTTLYEVISSAVVDGELPRDFSLPKSSDGKGGISWADGAVDGVSMYHRVPPELNKDDMTLMSDAVRAADRKDYYLADRLFLMLGKHVRTIFAIDALQAYIIEHRRAFNAKNLFEYAMHLLFESDDRECVKFGLSLMELFSTDGQNNLRKAIRTFGLSDEFALFAIFVMQRWEDGNNEIWKLAQKLHGWGRIHAVERIEPDTDEIRKWLLTEGVHNDVMPAYSALTCWNKSGAEAVLKSGPSREEFTGIRDIIEGLLDEGPVAGISAIENRDEIISGFIEAAGSMELTQDDREVIQEIYDNYKGAVSESCDIAKACRKLLDA